MYNQRFFRKINDKKVLHKIGKRWAVLSVSLLGAVGVTGMVTSHAHANHVDNANPNSASVNNQQSQPAQTKLVSATQSNLTESTSSSINNNTLNSATNKTDEIQNEAHSLYQSIILNGLKHLSQPQITGQISNQNNGASNGSNVTTPSTSYKTITGRWGTAPFQFDLNSGQLQTTGKGTIKPLDQLNQIPFSDVKSIQFAPGTIAPYNSTGLFKASDIEIPTTDGHYGSDSIAYVSALRNLKKIDLTNLNTNQVVSMAQMFGNDSGLQRIIFGPRFNTANVNEMAEMFQSDNDLKSLDLSTFDTSNVLDMSSMFKSDDSLSDLNLGNHFNTRRVNYMSDMFQSDNDLRTLDLGPKFYLNYPKSLSHMFINDYALTSLNLGTHFNTQNVTNMSDMFANDSDLNSLNLGSVFYTAQVSDMHDLFKDDANLRTINLGSHFDTTKASTKQYTTQNQVMDNSYSGAPGAYESYTGAKGLFNGDQSLNQIQMDNTKLVGPVDLSVPTLTAWYLSNQNQVEGMPINLNDGKTHSGTYQLSSTDPVITTDLNFQDVNHGHQSIGDILISGLRGSNIPFATISNALGAGYVSTIPISDLMKTFPNTPYQYQLGTVNIPVKKVSNESTNGNVSPVTPNGQPESNAVNGYLASLADQKIASYYQSSVASSVSIANQQKAKSAAASADQNIELSEKSSVTSSVSIVNQQLANSAATSADRKIDGSIANSAAESADRSLDTSIANSAALSADESLDSSIAQSAAHSADLRIEQSIADSYANSMDKRIEASERDAVTNSVSIANQQKTQMASELRDRKIESSVAPSMVCSTAAKPVKSFSTPSLMQSTSDQNPVESSVQSTTPSASNSSSESTANYRNQVNHLTADSTMTSFNSQTVESGLTSVANQPARTRRKTRAIIHDDEDRNAPVNRLKLRQKLMIGKKTVTREPVKVRKVRLKHRCVIHRHLIRVDHVRDASRILKRGTTIRVEKKFQVRSGYKSTDDYEILANGQQSFVTAGELFPTSVNVQPNELWHYHVYGKTWRRYYRVIILKACFTYKHGHRKKRLHRGSIVHVKGIVFTGRKGHRKAHLLLTNGQLITASRKYVKLV